ncbi:hypothetical protein DICSQDRAFT_155288 [Dichomitus squalens LYAD-421 SS1]|uniref:Uncharacterized protein n=1 Tax=Dichomitus squalens (strain LYAD-421) TaxID=732165 RepID=R7SYH6_DICSQ|nr:uncharacterized protein DICSQDRAFT_155288 [Dichomitus squalens LYAD-421 SS1]EJF61199.1 hypothetical protein DICSQDRAFT_155288 [Dichomitus squalens LYAD-421 SS1]
MSPLSLPNNMGPQRRNVRRKPVPRLSPDTTTAPSLPARGIQRLSLTININKEVPPLPVEWSDTMEHASTHDKRHAVYLRNSLPPELPPKDDESVAGSRPESPNSTLVEELEVQEGSTPVLSPQSESLPVQSVECTLPQPTPDVRRRASQKSLPKIYRPPTPPIPAQYPKLRSGGHSRASSQDSQTHIIYNGHVSAEQRDSAPPSSTLTSWPGRLGTDVSVTAHSLESRSNVLSFAGSKDLPPRRGGTSPHVRRQSAGSMSTGNRSSTGRSQFTCHSMCSGMWYALKRLGLHLRVKVGHNTKY